MRKPRRWGLRFFMFFGFLGLGAFLARDHLPRFPRSVSEVAGFFDALGASVRRAGSGLTGKSSVVGPVGSSAPSSAAATPPRGPEIVPLPSAAPPAEAASPPKVRPQAEPAPAPVAAEPRPAPAAPARARSAPPRPARVAMAPKPARKAERDPFEDADVPAVPEKQLRTTAILAAREAAPAERAPAPAAAPAPRAAAAPKPAAGSLEDLMSATVKPTPKARTELDRRLAGINETRDAEPARKKVEAEPPPPPALSRNDVQSAMRGIQPKVNECYKQFGKGGPADVKVTVSERGAVTAVALSGPFEGTPTGSCVERAVRSARFPESAGLRFDYRLTVR
jgi:hypothetical protein